MKKVKKVLSVILIVSVVMCSLYVGIHTIYLQSHRSEAVDYLVEKYARKMKIETIHII